MTMGLAKRTRAGVSWSCAEGVRWLLLLVCLWLCLGAQAQPARRALLVGVSELPGQPESSWLRAPRHDVQLMRQTLAAQGWPAQGIQVLADGVAGAEWPRLEAIRAALAQLVAQAQPGELVLLYFSGHGVRLHGAAKSYDEPDGLTEVFMARDGALRDAEMGGWIQAILAKGAFVWAVFDTCSATSMTRGGPAQPPRPVFPETDDDVRFRGLSWSDMDAAFRRLLQASLSQPTAIPSEASMVPPARYVALFAAESHQLTPELRLPRGRPDAAPHGLLTWAITEALAHRPATWRDLFIDVLGLYGPITDELAQRYPDRELPSPVMEGALDARLFDDQGVVASTLPVWPARRDGDMLRVAAGRLDGLAPGQRLHVTARLPSGQRREFEARAGSVALGEAQVALSDAMGSVPAASGWQARAFEAPVELALRVRAEAGRAQRALRGLSLTYPASIRMIAAGEADWQVSARDSGFWVESPKAEVGRAVADAAALRRFLADQASFRWLQSVADLAQWETPRPLAGFRASLISGPSADGAWKQEPLSPRPAEPSGQSSIEIENGSGASVDLLVVGVTAGRRLIPIFPATLGETNRFERGDAQAPARKRFALPPPLLAPGGALLVMATPVRPRSPVRLYGFSPMPDDVPPDVRLRSASLATGDMAYVVMARW